MLNVGGDSHSTFNIQHSTFNIQHSSYLQDDFPEGLSCFQRTMGLCYLCERKHAVDDRPQATGFDVLHDFVKLGEATHCGAKDGEEFEENEIDVDRGFVARGRAAGDQSPASCQRLQRTGERLGTDVLHHDVHTAFPSESPHSVDKV